MPPTCPKHDGCRATPKAVQAWMREHAPEYRERLTDEPMLTQLAEAAADEFDHHDWLDDEQHPVWDWSIAAFGDA